MSYGHPVMRDPNIAIVYPVINGFMTMAMARFTDRIIKKTMVIICNYGFPSDKSWGYHMYSK